MESERSEKAKLEIQARRARLLLFVLMAAFILAPFLVYLARVMRASS